MTPFDWMSIVPFIGMTGKTPEFNLARLIEAFIIGGITMFGTVQAMSTKLENLQVVVNDTRALALQVRDDVVGIRISRAGRAEMIDAERKAQDRINQETGIRLQALEKRK